MKVDMSPHAVTGRLRAMGDLWLLSVKLMNSKLAKPESTRSRALEIQDSIRQVLLVDWDPIGISDIPEAADEYDSYISPIYRILVGTRSEDDLIECLRKIEREEMEVGPTKPEMLRRAAKKLLNLEANLD